MRIFGIFLLSALCAAAAPGDLDGVIAAAQSVPAEFSADALIRIAALDRLPKEQRLQLLEQAFQRAEAAQEPYKRHAAPIRNDGAVGYWNRVYSQDLDVLSLRLRAVETMIPLDPAKAREWFAKIPPLNTPKVKCEEYRLYDLARFYTVLGELIQHGFTAAESAAGEPSRLLLRYSTSMTSPVQAGPLAHVIAAATTSWKDEEFKTVAATFGTALGKLYADDRSFTYSSMLAKEIQALAAECKRRGVPALPVLEGYRVYLVIHLSSARCADDDQLLGTGPSFGVFGNRATEEPTGDFVTFFNDKLQTAPLKKIEETEATPARLEGVAAIEKICQDSACQDIAKQMRGLILSDAGTPYTPAEREKPEWQAKLKAALTAIAGWKAADGVSVADFYREKCAAYGDLLTLVQNSPAREPVLQGMLAYVSGNSFQSASRVEWFLPVNALVGRVGLDPLGLGTFAAELKKSSDPVIALYATLESIAPRPPDRILALL